MTNRGHLWEREFGSRRSKNKVILSKGVTMFPNMQQYMKAKYGNLPEVEVTREEFVEMMMAHGKTREQAEFQATMSVGLGAAVMMGEKMVKIKEEAPDGSQDNH